MPDQVSFALTDADIEFLKGQAVAHMPRNEDALLTTVAGKLGELEGILRAVPHVPDFVRGFVGDLRTLYEMLRDDASELSDQTRGWALYALSYLVNPVDTIPDTVPLVGWLDDIIVVGWVCGMLRGEMKVYRDLKG